MTDLSTIRIDSLPIPKQVKRSLGEAGYSTVAELDNLSNDDLDQIGGIGDRSIEQIRDAIAALKADEPEPTRDSGSGGHPASTVQAPYQLLEFAVKELDWIHSVHAEADRVKGRAIPSRDTHRLQLAVEKISESMKTINHSL